MDKPPKRSPVDAALMKREYWEARRAGPEPQLAFVAELLEQPVVKRSRVYTGEALRELFSIYWLEDDVENAVATAERMMANGFRYPHEAYYLAKPLFYHFSLTRPTLEIIDVGYGLVAQQGYRYWSSDTLLQLRQLELVVRLVGRQSDDVDFEALLAQIGDQVSTRAKFADSLSDALLIAPRAGSGAYFARQIAEQMWAEQMRQQKFHGEQRDKQIAALEALIEEIGEGHLEDDE